MKTRDAPLLFLAFAFALYWNSLDGDYVFDDWSTFQRKWIREMSLSELVDEYRPLRYLSLRADEALYRLAVRRELTPLDERRSHHVFNVILHGLTALVVFVILRRLAGPGVALAGALLFVAHPAHTECVAYMSGRRDVLSTLIYLLGFLCWLQFNRGSGWLRWLWLPMVALCAGLAYGSKESAVTLPAVCVLYDLVVEPKAVKRNWPAYALGGALAAGLVYRVLNTSGATHVEGWHGASLGANIAISARLLVHYAALTVFPLKLLGDYSYNAWPLSESLLDPRALVAYAVIAACAWVAWYARRRAPLITFGIGWFVVTLAPILQIVPFHEIAADHHLYLASVGFCLLGGLGFEWLRRRSGAAVAWVALALVLAAFSVRTVIRNRDWSDAETFWRATIATAPECARAHYNLGVVFAKRMQDEKDPEVEKAMAIEAAKHMQRAVDIMPDYITARVGLGQVYQALAQGERDRDAASRYRQAANTNLEEALRLSRPMRFPPTDPGRICILLGRIELAAKVYEERIRMNSRALSALNGLITCERALADSAKARGLPDEAEAHLKRALEVAEQLVLQRPKDIRVLRLTARLARELGDDHRAQELEDRANRLVSQR